MLLRLKLLFIYVKIYSKKVEYYTEPEIHGGDFDLKKNIPIYILTTAVLFVATFLVIALSVSGKLPFLNGVKPQTSDTSVNLDESEDEFIDESEDEFIEESDEESEVSAPDVSEPDEVEAALAGFDKVDLDGYRLTDAMFKKNEFKLAVVKHYETLEEGVSLLPRMGFIFQTVVSTDEDGETVETISLLDERGEVLFEVFESEFAGVRDALDNPLFKDGKKYYYLDRETLEFVETTYTKGENGRGVEFDYPSYYGRYQDDYTVRRKRSGQWGIYDSTTEEYIVYPYRDMVFTFNGNPIACTYDNDSSKLKFYELNTDLFNDKYYKPETNGLESIGYYHFIDELTRVRRVYSENGKKVSAQELMYTDGTLFNLPADFELKAYSDAVLLLCREDKYGYMSSKGRWITNPEYDSAAPFLEGLAVVGKDGKYGVIATDGSVVVPLVFDEITNCSGGVMILYAEGYGYYVVNKYAPIEIDVPIDESTDESTDESIDESIDESVTDESVDEE